MSNRHLEPDACTTQLFVFWSLLHSAFPVLKWLRLKIVVSSLTCYHSHLGILLALPSAVFRFRPFPVDLTSLTHITSHYCTTLPTVSHLQVFEHAVSFTWNTLSIYPVSLVLSYPSLSPASSKKSSLAPWAGSTGPVVPITEVVGCLVLACLFAHHPQYIGTSWRPGLGLLHFFHFPLCIIDI